MLKGGIVGFGFIASSGHFPAYAARKDVEIVAFADVCPARLDAARALAPKARFYATHEEMLAGENALDFVDIATPPAFHRDIALAALRRGAHVLCEKPLTTTIAEAVELALAARKYRRVVFPAHNYKHAPVVKFAGETIRSGRIGNVRAVTLNTFRTTHAKGVKEWRTDWRRDRKTSGGGIAMDHGSHSFYLTFAWMGSLPTHVAAKTLTVDRQFDTEDNLNCVLTFPNGYAHCFLTWTAGVRKVIYSLQGTDGALVIDDDDWELTASTSKGKPQVERGIIESHWMDASHKQWFDSLFEKFKASIAAGDHASAELREAVACIQIIETCYRSNAEGCRELPLSLDVREL
ncbi:MAG: Gfo/Idh/MocA family oxidoreductase [Deltaproteobacteria bacterium]|nr:MAG: Gfo/Idh/MocA family oxidoreductase [Deltaproteobacteria bacterium]TMB29228.1 MAG: Gfo/Idh/MocA family oxidoreductase [Deltaproteobacteria bacterium]TMB36481.1 MAG: Gfo/Idh/MocA family oxidoreductase [Deltaproteobacteria bacterium]